MKIIKRAVVFFAFWVIIIILSIRLSQKFAERDEVLINYGKFQEHLENKEIVKAIIENKEFHGYLFKETFTIINGKHVNYRMFRVLLPEAPTGETTERWINEYGITMEFKETSKNFLNYLLILLPFIILGIIIIFILRRRKE